MAEETTYEIQDGVRRAKAAWLCNRETIKAQINGGPVFAVSVNDLRSPHKDEIDVAGINGLRWNKVFRATRAGLSLPPIEIVPGTRGKTIEEVSVSQDELDLYR